MTSSTRLSFASAAANASAKLNLKRALKSAAESASASEALPFEAPADKSYGLLRNSLEKLGTPIGGNDLLIASQALALGYTIVTDDEREFSRVKGLRLQNWLRSSE